MSSCEGTGFSSEIETGEMQGSIAMRGNTMVTEHTNESEQATPENTEQQSSSGLDERRWYAIHTYSGYENKVKSHLEARIASMDMRNKIFRVIVPMEEEVEIKQGQRRTVQRKVFPKGQNQFL